MLWYYPAIYCIHTIHTLSHFKEIFQTFCYLHHSHLTVWSDLWVMDGDWLMSDITELDNKDDSTVNRNQTTMGNQTNKYRVERLSGCSGIISSFSLLFFFFFSSVSKHLLKGTTSVRSPTSAHIWQSRIHLHTM